MAYRLRDSPRIEEVSFDFEDGLFTIKGLNSNTDLGYDFHSEAEADFMQWGNAFCRRHAYWPSFEDSLHELQQTQNRHHTPRLVGVSEGQGIWIVPNSCSILTVTWVLMNMNERRHLRPICVGEGLNHDDLFLTGRLRKNELALLQEGIFPPTLKKIGIPGRNFRAGMIVGRESSVRQGIHGSNEHDIDRGLSFFGGTNAGPQHTRQQGEASRYDTRKADQPEGGEQRRPPAQNHSARHEQDDDDDYEIDDQPHRPQRRNTRRPAPELDDEDEFDPRSNIRGPRYTDDELDYEGDLQPGRNATPSGRSTQERSNRRPHDTDNELDSEDNLQPTRNATRAGGSRRPHDSNTELDRDGRLRPTRACGAGGAGRAGRSTPMDTRRSTLKGAIRDNGYKGKVDDEDEEPPAYEDVGVKSGRKGYRSGRTGF